MVAAAVGLVTGLVALVGHPVTTLVHAVGGVGAVVVPTVVALRRGHRRLGALAAGAGLVALVGLGWTALGGSDPLVLGHVLGGVAVTAGVGLLGFGQGRLETPKTG